MHAIKNDLHILEETFVKRVGGVGGKYSRLILILQDQISSEFFKNVKIISQSFYDLYDFD